MEHTKMSYLNLHNQALSICFERIVSDDRLFPSHISLFMALFYFSNFGDLNLPFQVSRSKLMRFSSIKSIATYHKNIKELKNYGYIDYKPSWHPQKGTQVKILFVSNPS